MELLLNDLKRNDKDKVGVTPFLLLSSRLASGQGLFVGIAPVMVRHCFVSRTSPL